MPQPSHPGVALFDLDGTLVDREPLAATALMEVCAEAGWHLSETSVGALVGRAWQDVHRDLEVLDRLGWDVSTFTETVSLRCVELGRSRGVPALDGAVELLDELVSRGVRVGVVTGSTSKEAASVLGLLELTDRIDHVVGAEHYLRGKPAPEPYLTALAHFDARADFCVALEDSAVGIEAARAAGLRVVGSEAASAMSSAYDPQELGRADLVVSTLADDRLVEWVLEIVTGSETE